MLIFYLQNPFQPFPLPLPFLLGGTIGGFGPTFAALIMAGIQERRAGIRKLLSGWRLWRVGIQWYVSIPLVTIGIPLGAIGLYIIATGASPQVDLGLWYMFFWNFLLAMPFGPLAEETGWRGYALPRLQASHSALTASLILGVLWTFWHAPGFLVPGMALPRVPLDWMVILNFLLRVVSVAILFTWLYNNAKGSILVAFLFHAALNSVPQTLLRIFFETVNANIIFWVNWFTVGLQWTLVAVLILAFGASHLSRK